MRLEHLAARALRLVQRLYIILVRRELHIDLPAHGRPPRGQARAMDEPRQMIGHVQQLEPCSIGQEGVPNVSVGAKRFS